MSDPIDIKALDEYLKGGSDISRALRELGRDEVPPELDRRVLDEARAAVAAGNGGRSRSWLRWSAPVALAASVVLGVTVLFESGVQNDASFAKKAVDEAAPAPQDSVRERLEQEQPTPVTRESAPGFAPEPVANVTRPTAAPTAAAPPPAMPAKAEAELAKSAAPEEVRVDAKLLREQSVAPAPVAAEQVTIDSRDAQLANSQPAPAVDSSARDLDTAAVSGGRVRRGLGRTAGPRTTVSTSSALHGESRPAADADAEQADPEQWLEEIRELRRAGKVAEADGAWERFRQTFPDFQVADDDIARKKR